MNPDAQGYFSSEVPDANYKSVEEPFDFKKVLAQYDMELVESNSDTHPGKVSHKGFEGLGHDVHYKRGISEVVTMTKMYLAAPTIHDKFKNHNERRAWRKEMYAQYGKPFYDAYEYNKLRLNIMFPMFGFADFIQQGVHENNIHTPESGKFVEITKKMEKDMEAYQKTDDPEEGIQIVERLDEEAHELLNILIEPADGEEDVEERAA